jgi:hypothetical protein
MKQNQKVAKPAASRTASISLNPKKHQKAKTKGRQTCSFTYCVISSPMQRTQQPRQLRALRGLLLEATIPGTPEATREVEEAPRM